MSNWHPDESQLLAYADSELPTVEAAAVALHIEECERCRIQAAEFRSAYVEVASALKAQLPPPPRPWADLQPHLNRLDAGRVRSRRLLFPRVNFKWVAAAAGLVLCVLAIRLLTQETVNAAELLRKATVEEARTAPAKRIRVKTRRAEWVRPANAPTLGQSDEATIAALFEEARYSWAEPLSPKSFSNWRSSLPEKEDRVKILQNTQFGDGRFYLITTSAPQGVLAEASITIRARDMRAVHESFQFRNNESVELTEEFESGRPLPEERYAQVRPQEQSQAEARAPLTAAHELQVVTALHELGADLGEPVEIERVDSERTIYVTALITDSERQQQIRTALAGLPFVRLRFDQPEAVRPAAPAQGVEPEDPDQPSAVQERLTARLGGRVPLENFTNHVMDLSEAALARAHALRALAQRFPPEVETTLSPKDLQTLHSIQSDHVNRLMSSARTITDVVRPLAPDAGAAGWAEISTWHNATGVVLESARRFDRVATETLAGRPSTEAPERALRNLARAASELQLGVEALQKTVARAGSK